MMSTVEVLSLITDTLPATAAMVLVAILLFCVNVLYRSIDRRKCTQAPIVPGLPVIPNAHLLLGHMPLLQGAGGDFRKGQQSVFINHANKHGVTTFWFLNTPAVSVLLGRHVRSVLMSTSMRIPISLIRRHGSQFLGPKTLLQLHGTEWKYYRSVVHKAFTPAALSSYQRSIELVCEKLVQSLRKAVVAKSSSSCAKTSTSGRPTSNDVSGENFDGSDTETESEHSTQLSDVSENIEPSCLTTEVLPIMKLCAIDIFAETSFGKDLECCSSLKLTPVARAFDYLTDDYTRRMKGMIHPACVFYWLPTPANYQHAKERNTIRSFVSNTLESRRQEIEEGKKTNNENNNDNETNSKTENLLTYLIKAVDEKPYEDSTTSSNEALTDVLMTLLFAGYDTTSITLTYALYLLSKHEEVRDKCLAEIDAVMVDSGRNADDSSPNGSVLDLDRLQYTRAVVMETLRLYPPVPVTTRNLERPLKMDGRVIPEKTHISIPIWSIQRDERNFPFPDHFLPRRWVERAPISSCDGSVQWVDRTGARDRSRRSSCVSELSSSDSESLLTNIDHLHHDCSSPDDIPPANLDAFCAFSGGGRSCPGRKIAVQEAVTILAYLLKNFRFDALDDYELRPVQASFIQKPNDSLPMRISMRR